MWATKMINNVTKNIVIAQNRAGTKTQPRRGKRINFMRQARVRSLTLADVSGRLKVGA
jgi:hypothetical protein